MAGNCDKDGGYEKANPIKTILMYSDKINVNILTSLMVAHGIKTVVVCPGSRNAPLAHNLASCPEINCVSVTDERSAGFYAIGLALASEKPVAVCVTSGSAFLNLAPAIAEAYYQEVPILIVSADRPLSMIGQLQGQTMQQTNILGAMLKGEVALPEPTNDTEKWYCNRLVNEAIHKLTAHGSGPVHVNVPISEPLYSFNTEVLPTQRKIVMADAVADKDCLRKLAAHFAVAEKPMLVIGQLKRSEWLKMADYIEMVKERVVVLAEKLSDASATTEPPLDMLVGRMASATDYQPDFVIYVGGNMVSKRIRQFLQSASPKRSVVVNAAGELADVMMNATDLVVAHPTDIIEAIALENGFRVETPWLRLWQQLKAETMAAVNLYGGKFSQVDAIRLFFKAIKGKPFDIHVANSMAVRIALCFADRYLYVNRGVNGIEGSLSTAAGYSLMASNPVACIIGDLSFFYDANALWHQGLCGNFRILLINNKCGGIFAKFANLADSPARDCYVMARHGATAEGVCKQNNIAYRVATDCKQLADGVRWLVNEPCQMPMLLEVMTDEEVDMQEYGKLK